MFHRFARHLRRQYVGYVALFLALTGGVAYAVDRNSVRSPHVDDGALRSVDIRDGTIREKDLSVSSNTAVAGGVVNTNGTTQVLTPGLSVSRTSSGKYEIEVPESQFDEFPVPVINAVGHPTQVNESKIFPPGTSPAPANAWLVQLDLPGDRLFSFHLVEVE